MALLDDSHEINNQTSQEFYEDELKNSRLLLFRIDEAINNISQANIQSYTLDTGQSRQVVTRADLPSLIEQRNNLLGKIRQLELYLREGRPNVKQVCPDW